MADRRARKIFDTPKRAAQSVRGFSDKNMDCHSVGPANVKLLSAVRRRPLRSQAWLGVGLVLTALAAWAGGEGALAAGSDQPAEPLRLLSPHTSSLATEALGRRRAGGDYGRLPLSFEPLRSGQAGAFRFVSRGSGYGLLVAPTEAAMVLKAGKRAAGAVPAEPLAAQQERAGRASPGADRASPIVSHKSRLASREAATLRLRLIGANAEARVSGRNELPGRVHHLKGNDPSKWRANVPTFGAVAVEAVYPGIDLVYYGSQQQLEFDFVVAPGAAPEQIEMAFQGADQIMVDEQGDLVLQVAGGQIRQHKPLAYQVIGGERREVAARYVLPQTASAAQAATASRVRLALADYDRGEPLVIDPILSYATFLGGGDLDRAWDVAVDREGNAYVTGITLSTDFLLANAFQTNFAGGSLDGDLFVLKLNPEGTALVYATYLGGDGDDAGFGIAVDQRGSAYVTGLTTSTDFPTANALQPRIAGRPPRGVTIHPFDAIVAKLNAAGSGLVYSTYLGGAGDDEGIAIAVDGNGSAYITGQTTSPDFPTVNAFDGTRAAGFDAFVTKLSPEGTTLVYSTYLGGDASDYGEGIAVDGAGAACVTGITGSTNFPTANALFASYQGGRFDVFVTKLDAAGTNLVYSTFLGGSDDDQGLRLALDGAGNAYVTGLTASTNFPVVAAAQAGSGGSRDAFVTKLDPAGRALLYSTYWGGGFDDEGWDIAVDAAGNAYIAGRSTSTNFPVTANALQSTNAGFFDAFVLHLPPAGAPPQLATLLGGGDQDVAYGIDVDLAGNVYVGGETGSTNFPALMPLRAVSTNGLADLFVLRLAPEPRLAAERVGDALVLSWPRSLSGFVLESAASPDATGHWSPAGAAPVARGLLNTVTVEASAGHRCFRLRKPSD